MLSGHLRYLPIPTQKLARRPPPLRPGDRVGVAALSGPVDPERLAAGLAQLRALGFEPVLAGNLLSRHRELFAGEDVARLVSFHELVADDSLKAIFFARGGWGVSRLLPALDWELLGRHPRAYIGYSDLTPFLLGLVARCDLVAFHGPMVAADFARGLSPAELETVLGALGDAPSLTYALQGFEDSAPGALAEVVEGPFLGGCLSLLASSAGTPWAIDLSGALLFLEDVAEPAYRIDRMLTQLRQSGSLSSIRAIIVGHLTALGGHLPAATEPEALLDVFREHAAALGVPLAWGLEAGHDAPNLTLPLGVFARLDPASRRLTLGFEGSIMESSW